MRIEERIRAEFGPIRSLRGVGDIVERARRRTRARRIAWAAPVVAVAAAAALVLPAFLPGSVRPAEAAFRALALEASDQPTEVVGPGQYLYSTFRARWETCDDGTCRWEDVMREQWLALDGSVRIHEIRGPEEWSDSFPPGQISILPQIPEDALAGTAALRAYVRERASHADQPLDYEMFVVVGDLLRETFSSAAHHGNAELRRSLFEIASTIRGVELLGSMSDEDGREGIGFGFTRGDTRLELIFDEVTTQLLGEREVSIEDGRTIPGSWVVYGPTGVVDSTRERP
jgi:hypothetical protein